MYGKISFKRSCLMNNFFNSFIVIIILLPFSLFIGSQEEAEVYSFEEEVKSQRFYKLVGELRCPKCQSSNLLGSDAPIAKDLKREIYRLIQLGKTNEEIKKYLSERYGDYILYKPPFKKGTWALWIGPFFLLCFIFLWVLLWKLFYNRTQIS